MKYQSQLSAVTGRPQNQSAPKKPPGTTGDKHFERALEVLQTFLASKKLHITELRRDVLRAALAYEGNFDAEGLTRTVRDNYRKSSLGAVYRTIRHLVEAQIVRPTVHSLRNSQFYEIAFERARVGHLVCQSCGTVAEFSLKAFDALRRDIAAKHAFELAALDRSDEILGVCADCADKQMGKERPASRRRTLSSPSNRATRANSGI